MQTIEEWLASLGLEEYAERFVANGVDLSVIGDLTEQDFADLGVLLGHRRKMLRAIAQLEPAPPPPAEAPDRPPAQEEAERRQLTVMFCDIVGSTALSARLDPEDMRQVIKIYHARIAEIIHRYQGIIARYMGDGVLVYFGYPRAEEDDAEQAVRAGLALIDAVSDLDTGVETALRIRVGIATGTVIVGDLLTGEGWEERTVVGDAPNLAARLQGLAEPGAVLICPDTYRLTKGLFRFRNLGPLTVRGWAEPVPAWQALESTEVESRFEARHETSLPPLFGREEEIELLLRRWDNAKRGEGRVVVLTGEPGIGKSHIALALDERLRAESRIALRFYCSTHHSNSVLFPIINQIERAAGFERGDSPADRLAKLVAVLARSTTDPDHVALLAAMLSLPPDDRYPLPDLTPQKRKEKTLEALLAQIEGLAARAPLLMIFEDVHWMDPTSLELLSATVERVPTLPVLVLVTARPEFTPPWPSYAHTSVLPLTRLARRDGAALIERVTGGKSLPDEVMNEILARTDGVPLFVEELTKTLLESGMLQERRGNYVLEKPLPSLAIPTTLQASLMARLDRLAPVREVAQIGAVIGREFPYELLSYIAEMSEERLQEALVELVRSGLVFRRGEIPEAVYIFKHALVRDAAYSGLLKSRRAQLHGTIARALAKEFQDIARAQPEIVAHHFTEAGLFEDATRYWLEAGRNAAGRSANIEAIAHLQKGLETVSQLPEGTERDRAELDLRFVLGPCLIATRGPASADAVATFSRARTLCENLEDPPEYLQVLFWLTTASVMRGELPQAHESITALLNLAEARGDRPALLNAMRGHSMILLFMGRVVDAYGAVQRAVEAFDACDEADRLAARAAGQDARVADLALMSWALWLLGYPDQAAAAIAEALQRADEIRHPHTQAYARYYASVLHALRDEPEIAREHAGRCLELAEEHGFGQWRGLAHAVHGICTAVLEESQGPLDEVRDSLESYRGADYQLGMTALFVLLCPVLLQHGQREAALEIIDRGLSTASENAERLFEAELYRLKARALFASDDDPKARRQARSLLDEALASARESQSRSLELRAATDLAAFSIEQGDHGQALEILEPIRDWFTEGLDTYALQQAGALIEQMR